MVTRRFRFSPRATWTKANGELIAEKCKDGCTMAIPGKKSRKDIEAELARSQVSEIEAAELVRGGATSPITFRASAPLLERIDALAAKEHRTRANLISHILWTYLRENEKA
jgi:hypothetical protein